MWAADAEDIETAGRIAAHAAMLGWLSMRYEPLDWVEELIDGGLAQKPPVLPRLLIAGMLAVFRGGAAEADDYDRHLTGLGDDQSFDPFELDVSLTMRGLVHSFNGRPQRSR